MALEAKVHFWDDDDEDVQFVLRDIIAVFKNIKLLIIHISLHGLKTILKVAILL